MEDVRESRGIDAGGVPEKRGGSKGRVPNEGVLGERDERETLAAEAGRFPDVVEEGSGKQHVGIHLRPADGAREGEGNLRSIEGVLRKAADVGVVVAFGRGRIEEPWSVVDDFENEGLYPGVFDLCYHTAESPLDPITIDGCIGKQGRIEPVPRQRGQEIGYLVVDVDLAGAVVDLRVALDAVDLADHDRAIERLDLPYVVGRPPDLAGPPARVVGDGELDVLASVPFLL